MNRDQLEAAATAVTEARAYTIEHFGRDRGGKYVGHMPAADYDLAVEALAAALRVLLRRLDLAEQALAAAAAESCGGRWKRTGEGSQIERVPICTEGCTHAAARATLAELRAPLDQPSGEQ